MLIKLHDAGINGRMFYWIMDFFSHRSIQVGVFSETGDTENGMPQGSVISPVIFNVMINDNFQKVYQGFGESFFADNGAIWRNRENIRHLFYEAQKALNQVLYLGSRSMTSRGKFIL